MWSSFANVVTAASRFPVPLACVSLKLPNQLVCTRAGAVTQQIQHYGWSDGDQTAAKSLQALAVCAKMQQKTPSVASRPTRRASSQVRDEVASMCLPAVVSR
jgi:hypothetical protein